MNASVLIQLVGVPTDPPILVNTSWTLGITKVMGSTGSILSRVGILLKSIVT